MFCFITDQSNQNSVWSWSISYLINSPTKNIVNDDINLLDEEQPEMNSIHLWLHLVIWNYIFGYSFFKTGNPEAISKTCFPAGTSSTANSGLRSPAKKYKSRVFPDDEVTFLQCR